MLIRHILQSAALIVSFLIVSACGGGGGGSNQSASPPPPTASPPPPPPVVSTEPVNVPFLLEPPLNVGPVFVAGSFSDWDPTVPANQLEDADGDGEWTVVLSLEQGVHDFRYYQGDRQWIRDPNIQEIDAPWGNSRIVVSDPMIVYLTPLDGGVGLRPGEPIRAVLGFSDLYPIDPDSIELSINGVPVFDAASYYDPATQTLSYTPPELLEQGQYSIEVSASSEAGTATRTTTIDRAPAIEFLTQEITYRKSSIVAYGTLNDPGLTELAATFNGNPVAVDTDGNRFSLPIDLINGLNTVEASGIDGFGNTVVSQQTLQAEIDRGPIAEIQGSVSGSTVQLTAVGSAHDDGPLTFEWLTDDANPEPVSLSAITGTSTTFSMPGTDGEYYFTLVATDSAQRTFSARRFLTVQAGAGKLNEINDHAAWVEDAVLYLLLPEISSPERTLDGVTARLDEVADLGVNLIQLTPVFATEHDCSLGYGTADYYGFCEARNHNASNFQELVDTAHSLGIRVILDIALDHLSYRHPFFQNVLDLGAESPYVDYFLWEGAKGESNYLYESSWWEWPYINYENPEVVEYFLDVGEHWIREYGLDGYRLDVASAVNERSPDFWPVFRRRVKSVRPESYLLSEGIPPTVNLYEGRFDSNFDFDLVGFGFEDRNALIKLLDGDGSIDEVHEVLSRDWPEEARPVRFVESHDLARMPYRYDLARSQMAHALVATVPGIPMFMAGGEFGMSAPAYGFDILIDWSDAQGTKTYFKKLIDIRKNHVSADGDLTRLSNTAPESVYSYRTDSRKGTVVTLLNFSPAPIGGTVDASSFLESGVSSYLVRNLLNDTEQSVTGADLSNLAFGLEGHEASILAISPE